MHCSDLDIFKWYPLCTAGLSSACEVQTADTLQIYCSDTAEKLFQNTVSLRTCLQAVYAKTFWALPDIWRFSPDIWLNLTAVLTLDILKMTCPASPANFAHTGLQRVQKFHEKNVEIHQMVGKKCGPVFGLLWHYLSSIKGSRTSLKLTILPEHVDNNMIVQTGQSSN